MAVLFCRHAFTSKLKLAAMQGFAHGGVVGGGKVGPKLSVWLWVLGGGT